MQNDMPTTMDRVKLNQAVKFPYGHRFIAKSDVHTNIKHGFRYLVELWSANTKLAPQRPPF